MTVSEFLVCLVVFGGSIRVSQVYVILESLQSGSLCRIWCQWSGLCIIHQLLDLTLLYWYLWSNRDEGSWSSKKSRNTKFTSSGIRKYFFSTDWRRPDCTENTVWVNSEKRKLFCVCLLTQNPDPIRSSQSTTQRSVSFLFIWLNEPVRALWSLHPWTDPKWRSLNLFVTLSTSVRLCLPVQQHICTFQWWGCLI